MRDTKKILESKIVYLKKIYKFYFDNFLLKCTVLILCVKNCFYKSKKSTFWPNYAICEKMLRSKIVYLKKIYKFCIDHFLIKRTVFVLIEKNVIKNNKKLDFPFKQCDIRKNGKEQNCWPQKCPPILYWTFFDRISSFRLNHEK